MSRSSLRRWLAGATVALALLGTACSPGAPGGSSSAAAPPATVPTSSAALSGPDGVSALASRVPDALAGRDWERIPTARRVVALTFDAGASAAGVRSILATLTRERVLATFFLTGQFARTYPSAARRLAASGRIGNHSATHPYFTKLSNARIRSQVRSAATTIEQVTGKDPAPLFRFPFGDRNARTIAAVNALGYVPVRWTVDTLGWQGTSGGRTVSSVVRRVLAALRPGAIVLMHVGANPDDGSTLDAAALPRLIPKLRARGYGFVTLHALLVRR